MPHGSSAAFTAILLRAAATSAAICISSSSSEAAVACVGSKQHVGEAASLTLVRAIRSASTKCSREAAGGRRGFVSFSAVVLCKTALKGYSPGLQIR